MIYEKTVQGFNKGFIYKNVDNYISGEGVCYIPELFDTQYTKEDLIRLCIEFGFEGDEDALFDDIDWQSPETLLEEWQQIRFNEEEMSA